MKQFPFYIFLFAVLLTPSIALAGNPKLPVQDDRYAAKYVGQTVSDPIIIEAGTTKEVTITFKNVGTATWVSETGAFITAYTVNNKYRNSVFANSSWIKQSQPAKINSSVLPGATGEITLSLTAPEKLGVYTEEFFLGANNYTWLDGGYFYLDITVVARSSAVIETPPTPTEEEVEVVEEVAAGQDVVSPFFISRRALELEGGAEKKLRFGLRNISDETLKNISIVAVSSTDAMFAHTNWESAKTIATLPSDVDPQGMIKEYVHLYAPTKKGTYEFEFALADANGIVPGSQFTIPVKVTTDAPRNFQPPIFAAVAAPLLFKYEAEPRIRVGLAKIETGSMFFSSQEDYHLELDGEIVYTLPAGTIATLRSSGDVYVFSAATTSIESETFLRLEPVEDKHAEFTLDGGFERDITWKGRTDFLTYRGAVELRHAVDTDETLYAINDLLLEDYVAGVAEVSNSAPTEFLKAQTVLARTYATYIKGTNKHAKRHFDVVAHTGDQLYLGTAIEQTTPNYFAAAIDTRSEMVLFDDAVVITPYFGNSDGETRSFHDVWGGTLKPWLVEVPAEYDLGRRLYGHGVGMSQRDAMARAAEENLSYQELIKHYYTGVAVERMFE
jgi:hypothetical protein